MTSRGSRFNPYSGGAPGKNSEEWLYTTTRNTKEFIRKWGHMIKHDTLMKPIVPPKYNIGFIIKNCNNQLILALEPWCSTIYVDEGNTPTIIKNYIDSEQPNTSFDLNERVKPYDNEKNNEILVEIDGNTFNNQDYSVIQQFSEITQDSGEVGEFELGNLKITVNKLKTYENNLIVNER